MISNTAKKFKVSELISCCIFLAKESCHIINDVRKSSNLQTQMKGVDDPVTQADFQVQSLIFSGLNRYFPDIKLIGEEDQEPLEIRSYDYSKINLNLLPTDLFYANNQEDYLDCDKAVIFIDPLDGTQDFVNNKMEAVSTLIGLAYEGRPVMGVTSHGFFKQSLQDQNFVFQPKIYFGYTQLPKVFVLEESEVYPEAQNIIPKEVQKKQADPNQFSVCVSGSRFKDFMKKNLEALNPTQLIQVGGCGYKLSLVLTGLADLYIYESAGTKRWDTCASEALIRCLGGNLTGIDGIEYSYVPESDAKLLMNDKGVIASLDKNKFQRVIDNFNQIYKEQQN